MVNSVVGGFQKITKNRSRSYFEDLQFQEKQKTKKDTKRQRRVTKLTITDSQKDDTVSFEEDHHYDYEY